jgi:hypothetical protein
MDQLIIQDRIEVRIGRSAAQLKAEREAAQESLRNWTSVFGGGGERQ